MASLGMQINSPLHTEPDKIDRLQMFAKHERKNKYARKMASPPQFRSISTLKLPDYNQ
jgi:hypothetical protein